MSGSKGQLNEGGIRVPTIVRWPAALDGCQVSDVLVITQDWTATILDAVGVQPADSHPLDGHSLLPYLIEGAQAPGNALFWRTSQAGALRSGRWKYLRANNVEKLYDVPADPREQANLAKHHPDILNELCTRWEQINADLLPYPATAAPTGGTV